MKHNINIFYSSCFQILWQYSTISLYSLYDIFNILIYFPVVQPVYKLNLLSTIKKLRSSLKIKNYKNNKITLKIRELNSHFLSDKNFILIPWYFVLFSLLMSFCLNSKDKLEFKEYLYSQLGDESVKKIDCEFNLS